MIQTILTQEQLDRHERFTSLDAAAQAHKASASENVSEYWWSLYLIYKERVWDSSFEKQNDWLGDLCRTWYGPTRSQFFEIVRVIDGLSGQGLTPGAIKHAIGGNKTAIIHELGRWFAKDDANNYALTEDAAKKLGEVSLEEFVSEIVSLSPGEATARIKELRKSSRSVFPVGSEWAEDGKLLVRLMERGGEEPDVLYDLIVQVQGEISPTLKSYLVNKFQTL